MVLILLKIFKITLNLSWKKHETLTENPPVQIYANRIKNRIVFIHCNLVNNNYQQASTVLFTFVRNKQFGQLINIAPHSLTMLSTINTEFSFIEVWFTDQNSELPEIEDNINLTLIIGLTL